MTEDKPHAAPLGGTSTTYSPEIAVAICTRLMEGKSLRSICAIEGMPAKSTVHLWVLTHKEFAEQYNQARAIQFETWADEILDISDTTEIGEKVKIGPDGKETTTGDMIEHRKLRTDNRKWLLSKLASGKFGDRTQLVHSGDVGLKVQVVGGLPDEEPTPGGNTSA